MYVCVCNAVTDRHIRHAVRNGVLTFEQLRMELRVSTCCGRCEPFARQVLAEAVSEQFPAFPARVHLPLPSVA
ncbi:MAG: (2Fe-2S)-binding protein [Halofilum sp. (in: g-proteobacteria)]|nr:(2Fe-2S)-binding protein [Halofilum sp. (in: g-proteobacteria)]